MTTDVLLTLVAKRKQLLEQLRGQAGEQLALIGSGDLPKLLALLAAKQSLIVELQSVQAALKPFRDERPESRVWSSAAERERCLAMWEECEIILGQIMIAEREGETQLVRRRDHVEHQLRGMHSAQQARQAYQPAAAATASSIQFSSEG